MMWFISEFGAEWIPPEKRRGYETNPSRLSSRTRFWAQLPDDYTVSKGEKQWRMACSIQQEGWFK
jgi:hypothetical protein